MATAYLNDGATALGTAGNWSDATGVANDATLVIPRGSQTIPGVDLSASAAAGVDYLHIMRAFSGSIGGGGTPLTLLFDATYTTKPNFIHSGSGFVYLTTGSSTTACTVAVLDGPGTLYLTGGTFTTVYANSGILWIGAGATVTNLVVSGSAQVIDTFTSSLAFTSVTITGSGNVSLARQITTATISGSGTTTINAPGETVTTLNQNNPGSTVVLLAANITTANLYGTLDLSQLQTDATVGGTATNIYPTGSILGDGNPRATVSNKVYIGGANMAGPSPN